MKKQSVTVINTKHET